MKRLLLCLLAVFILIQCDEEVEEFWMEMPLNHFNLFDNRTWKMRYLVKRTFFREGNPLFLEIGGETTIHPRDLKSGQLVKLAQQHEGMLVETEHRYYGESLPFENHTTENFKYLQIEQALEDLAFFIERFKQQTKGLENSLVILHGCSYPGMLATWMRVRFPHIVDAAYASSAPLGVGLDYPEFYEIVNDVYANVSEDCIETIRTGFNTTAKLLRTKKGRDVVQRAYKGWQCGDVKGMTSVEFLRQMANVMGVLNDPHNYEEVACLALSMDRDDSSAFERLAKFIILKTTDRRSCVLGSRGKYLTEEEVIEILEQMDRDAFAWSYQTCTEMGTFPTIYSTNAKHPFGVDFPFKDLMDNCEMMFEEIVTGEVLRKGTERVTRRYGGKKPVVTRVVTVQGTDDPWKHLASLENYTSEAPVFVVKGNHCVDISAPSEDVPEDIVKIQTVVRDIVSKWIRELSAKN